MIFYALHELFNTFEVSTSDGDNGKRNCRLVLLGTCLWVILFVLIQNLKIYMGHKPVWFDSVITGLFVILLTDIAVMSYIYKSYFGRYVGWEAKEADALFDYDKDEHKYKMKPSSRDQLLQSSQLLQPSQLSQFLQFSQNFQPPQPHPPQPSQHHQSSQPSQPDKATDSDEPPQTQTETDTIITETDPTIIDKAENNTDVNIIDMDKADSTHQDHE